MTAVDFIIIGVIALSSVISLMRGFVKEALSMAAWILAFWVAFSFAHRMESIFTGYVESDNGRLIVAFIVLFLVTLIVGSLINTLISRLVRKAGMSGTDRMLGVVFGFGRGVLLVAVVVLLAGIFELPKEPWWKESFLIEHFEGIASWIKGLLPAEMAKGIEHS